MPGCATTSSRRTPSATIISSNVDLASSKVLVAGQNGVSRTANIKTDYGNLAPRVGFSTTLPWHIVFRGGYGLSYYPGNYMSQSFLKSAPFTSTYGPVISNAASGGTPNLFLNDGVPPPTPTDIAVPSGSFQAEIQDFKNTRVQQYNLFVEKEFDGNVIGAGYLGWNADHLTQYIGNVNLAPAAAGTIQPRRAFSATLPNVNSIALILERLRGTYNAMQLVFQRRQRAGLTVSSSYTLSHAVVTNTAPWDVTVIERYDSDFDIRHRFVFSVNYELPFYRSESGVAAAILGGWQVNANTFWQSGLPFTVGNGTARSNTGGGDRPNQIGDPVLSGNDRTLDAMVRHRGLRSRRRSTRPATPGAPPLHGPPQRRIDLSLFKNISMSGDDAAAAAGRDLQPHQHPELRQSEFELRHGGLW